LCGVTNRTGCVAHADQRCARSSQDRVFSHNKNVTHVVLENE
jgi:hypothetical protein